VTHISEDPGPRHAFWRGFENLLEGEAQRDDEPRFLEGFWKSQKIAELRAKLEQVTDQLEEAQQTRQPETNIHKRGIVYTSIVYMRSPENGIRLYESRAKRHSSLYVKRETAPDEISRPHPSRSIKTTREDYREISMKAKRRSSYD
jgi:hypothetical protein